MTDRPILFSAPMIRALLDGRKTQTRRILTRNNATVLGHSWRGKSCPWAGLRFNEAIARSKNPMTGTHDSHLAVPFCHPADEPTPSEDCGTYAVRPLVETGDRLWVREAWRFEPGGAINDAAGGQIDYVEPGFHYRADYRNPAPGWKPGIHMPRKASRLTLTVTDVRVQRLQEISEADAIAEGIEPAPAPHTGWRHYGERDGLPGIVAVDSYRTLWNHINGAGSWAANPWIVAVTFTVERRNIDAARAA